MFARLFVLFLFFFWGGGWFSSHSRFFFHMETSPLPVKGCKVWPRLRVIEQWGFSSVPYLLWHGASVYKGHLRGPVTLNLLPSVWQWNCRYLLLRLRSVAAGIRTPNLPLVGRTLLPIASPPRHSRSFPYWRLSSFKRKIISLFFNLWFSFLHCII